MESRDGYVRTEVHQEIGIIEFSHTQGNSLPGVLLKELALSIQRAGHDPGIKAIVLRSTGDRVFCAGASFDELVAISNEQEGMTFFLGFAQVINAMRKCPKFIITRVQGKCVGGGVGIAAASDYCIAVENAEVRLSELAIGIGPFVVGPVIERKMGLSAFSQLAIDARMWRNAEWARRRGLFAEVHSTAEEMDEAIRKLCLSLIHSNPEAMAEMKKIMWLGTEDWDSLLAGRAAISGRLVLSPFTKEAIRSFKQKSK